MKVAEKIKQARLEAGMTQKALAEKLNIPYQSIGQWEREDRHPTLQSLRRIAEALNVPLVTLPPDEIS